MRHLTDLFEGLLDANYDVDDNEIFIDVVKNATGCIHDHELPTVATDGEWLVFDCAKCGNYISINTVEPFKQSGYSKYRFKNCSEVELFYPMRAGSPIWSDFEIDAPVSKINFANNDESITLTNICIL